MNRHVELLNNVRTNEPTLDTAGSAQRCTTQAAEAIYHLWDSTHKTFWRSTIHRAREKSKTGESFFFPTVTLRCVGALVSLVADYPDWASEDIRRLLINECLPSLVKREVQDLKSSLDGSLKNDELNLFTLSLYMQAFAAIYNFRHPKAPSDSDVLEKLEYAVQYFIGHSTFSQSDNFGPNGHPFILYHICRSLALCIPLISEKERRERLEQLGKRVIDSQRDSVERLIAKHRLGSLNPSESVALAFCGASLATYGSTDDTPHVFSALDICFEAQDPSGCWPQGRVVRGDKDIESDRLEMPTYEIAWVVTETLVEFARRDSDYLSSDSARDAVQRLVSASTYAERSIIRLTGAQLPRLGWSSDQPYEQPNIESWTSATLLQSMLALQSLVDEFNRQSILKTFTTTSPRNADWPTWLRWEKFRGEDEVDHDYPVLQYLHNKFVKPISRYKHGLRSSRHSVSAILFGPPGTAKTTIGKAIADGLGWPVVLLSPGDFIERGLEFIEAQARYVFDRLMRLSRAVVIFDECDELFRDREPRPESEQIRGITAFVTASMLPKLQELHDRGQVIFFICTNNIESMDPAIKRGGRVDHIIGVGPPDRKAREKIIQVTIEKLSLDESWTKPKYFDQAIAELAVESERFTRTELQRAVRLLCQFRDCADCQAAKASVRLVVEQRFKPALTIGISEFERFNELKRQISQPITEGGLSHA